MEIRRYQSFEEFRTAADPIYRREPVNSTIELTVLHGNFRPADPLLLIVCSQGVPVGAAMQTGGPAPHRRRPVPLTCAEDPQHCADPPE